MAREKLTKQVVDRLVARTTRYEVWDTNPRDIGVRVGASGDKVFVLKYRQAGKRRLYTNGHYGDALTVEAARKKATILKGKIHEGKDRMGELRDLRREVEKARNAPTVEGVIDEFVQRYANSAIALGAKPNAS